MRDKLKMRFKDAFNKMIQGVETVKEKQELEASKVKRQIEVLEQDIAKLKIGYASTLDTELLNEITGKEINRRELMLKVELIEETFKSLGNDLTVHTDYEAEIEAIFNPLVRAEAAYTEALKKAREAEKELVKQIEIATSETYEITSKYKHIERLDRDIINQTMAKFKEKMLMFKEVNVIQEFIPQIENVVNLERTIPKLPTEFEIMKMEKRENHEEKVEATEYEWVSGE